MMRSALLYFICIIFCNCMWHYCAAQEKEVDLNQQPTHFFTGPDWSYLATYNKDVETDSVWKLYQLKKFTPVSKDVFNGGIPGEYYWFHFKVVNTARHTIAFYIDARSPRLNGLALYAVKNNKPVKILVTGDELPFKERAVNYKNFAFPFQLSASDSVDFLLYVNQVGNSFYLPLEIALPNQFQQSVLSNYLLNGITLGILLFVSILSLLFFINNSNYYIYFYYCLYIITSIMWVLSYFGLGFQYLWPMHPFVNRFAAPLMASLNLIVTIQICQELLRIKETNKELFNAGNICKLLLMAAGLFPVIIDVDVKDYSFNHTYLLSFLIVVIISILVSLYSILYYIFKKSQEATFYFIASFIKLIGILNLAMMELGLTPALFNLEFLLLGSLIIELTFMSFALAKRYRDLKINTYDAVIEAQEKERQKLAATMHDSISNTLVSILVRFRLLVNQFQKNKPEAFANDMVEIQENLEQVQLAARNISHDLMPRNIINDTLGELLNAYISFIKPDETGAAVPVFHFHTNERHNMFLPEIRLQIFRIVQELITNVLKHSKATDTMVELLYKKKYLQITVADNGIGISNESHNDGFGIENMRSRVELLHGNMQITQASHFNFLHFENPVLPGTCIIIQLPYKRMETDKELNY